MFRMGSSDGFPSSTWYILYYTESAWICCRDKWELFVFKMDDMAVLYDGIELRGMKIAPQKDP